MIHVTLSSYPACLLLRPHLQTLAITKVVYPGTPHKLVIFTCTCSFSHPACLLLCPQLALQALIVAGACDGGGLLLGLRPAHIVRVCVCALVQYEKAGCWVLVQVVRLPRNNSVQGAAALYAK